MALVVSTAPLALVVSVVLQLHNFASRFLADVVVGESPRIELAQLLGQL